MILALLIINGYAHASYHLPVAAIEITATVRRSLNASPHFSATGPVDEWNKITIIEPARAKMSFYHFETR